MQVVVFVFGLLHLLFTTVVLTMTVAKRMLPIIRKIEGDLHKVSAESSDSSQLHEQTFAFSLQVASKMKGFLRANLLVVMLGALFAIRIGHFPPFLGWVLAVSALYFGGQDLRFLISNYPKLAGLMLNMPKHKSVLWVFAIAYDLLCDESGTSLFLAYFSSTVLGLVYRPEFFVIGLVDVIVQSDTLHDVLKAVRIPSSTLVMTGLLGLIVIFGFTLIGFNSFYPSFYNHEVSWRGGGGERCHATITELHLCPYHHTSPRLASLSISLPPSFMLMYLLPGFHVPFFALGRLFF
jgi:hypothetical protein